MVDLPSMSSWLSAVGEYSNPLMLEFVPLMLFLVGFSVGAAIVVAIFGFITGLFERIGDRFDQEVFSSLMANVNMPKLIGHRTRVIKNPFRKTRTEVVPVYSYEHEGKPYKRKVPEVIRKPDYERHTGSMDGIIGV